MMTTVSIVLGLGLSGRSAARFLLSQKKGVLGIDDKLDQSTSVRELQSLGLFIQSSHDFIDWKRVSQLIISPGISPQHPIYQAAKTTGTPILTEIELALPHIDKPLFAVTGTNGKTSVTLLIEHVFNSAGIRAKALGNIGVPLCDYLLSPCQNDVLIIELSSYQLETLQTARFDAGVILNITPDHLERYANITEYARAKCRLQQLIKPGGTFLVHAQVAREFGSLLPSKQNTFTFGVKEAADLDSTCLESIACSNMSQHEKENILASYLMCRLRNISNWQFNNALATFKKPPHRIEFVREIEGVFYYDDSKGTNIHAVIEAVGSMNGKGILIAGGVDKGASYLAWKEHFLGKIKKIITLGQAAAKMDAELTPYFPMQRAQSLQNAVQIAAEEADQGDFVLLSPGCASFDMFEDYAHRGKEFQQAVQLLERRKS